MPSRSSDTATDFGRMESERQIREKPTTRWLDDVVTLAEREREEANEMILSGKRSMDEKHANFIPSLEKALSNSDVTKGDDRERQARNLLAKADTLLKIYHRADDAIATAFEDFNGVEAIQRNQEADVVKLKAVLGAGKRIANGDVAEVESGKGREAFEQAKGIFGTEKDAFANGVDVEEIIAGMEKGVKRMVRGME